MRGAGCSTAHVRRQASAIASRRRASQQGFARASREIYQTWLMRCGTDQGLVRLSRPCPRPRPEGWVTIASNRLTCGDGFESAPVRRAQVLVSGSTVTPRQWPAQAGHRHHRHPGWDAGLPHPDRHGRVRARHHLPAHPRGSGRGPITWAQGLRRPALTETQLTGAREMCDSNRYTLQQIADAVGCSRITLYRALSRTSGAAA